MEIKRDLYLNRLIRKKDTSKIKIITGLRRSGKSYLLMVLYRNYLRSLGVSDDQIVLVELDDEKNDSLLSKGNLVKYVEKAASDPEKKYYIILDEIQLVEDFVRAVNSINKHPNYDVYITGSNSRFLSKDINDEFKDRGTEINIRPLSFSEFYPAFQGEKRFALREYLKYGGMPGLFEEEGDLAKEQYLNNLMTKVYIDDIQKNINTRLVDELSCVVDALCSVTGSLTNPLNMANYLSSTRKMKIDNETVAKFFGGITDAFLFDQVKRYDIRGKEYLSTPSKYYCRDLGLRNVRLNFREPNQGFLVENAVYNELRARGYKVDVGLITRKKTNKSGKRVESNCEVDFVSRMGSREYYLQIMDKTPGAGRHADNEYDNLLAVPGSFKKIVIVNENFIPYTNDSGMLVIPLEDFLLDADSLDE